MNGRSRHGLRSDTNLYDRKDKLMKFSVRNPIDEGWYADPEARFYEGKYIIYVTHSLPFDDQHNHSCFVSEDLTNWEKIENIIASFESE